ncbi:HAD hydrolase-like protein [Candidatus Woesearchaeota archaeon]|nr:HAD hydrolase-like protein [Candidatus Woesearchaeota archaeon]
MGNLFIWDFHGVLEKDNEFAVQEVVNRILPEFGFDKKATVEECRMLYGKKWAEYYKYFAPDADEDIIHKMVIKSTEISIKEKIAYKYIKPTDFAHDVIKKISAKGHTNLIMSNSSDEALDYFLESVNMQGLFDHKFGADIHEKSEYGKDTKTEFLKGFLEKNNFGSIFLIDDMEQAVEMGKKFNAVTFRFHRNKTPPDSKANYVIDDLRELLNFI